VVSALSNQIHDPVFAEVKIENLASRKIAEAAGMKLEFIRDGMAHYARAKYMKMQCPICQHDALPEFTKDHFSYKRCPSCETLFVADDLRSELVYARYSKSYFEAAEPTKAKNAVKERYGYPSYLALYESIEHSFQHKLDLVLESVAGGRLLDAGTAYGAFMALASKHFECKGIDVSEHAVSVARERFGLDVRQASIDKDQIFPSNFFDVVVMWDVLEHLLDPIKGVIEVCRVLRPGGYLFLSTDDASNWLPRLLGRNWWALAAPLHVCHFSKKATRIALQRAGEFDKVDIVGDTREYKISEIISHFAVSYKSGALIRVGQWLGTTALGAWPIEIRRPEQFIAVARKK